VQPFEFGVEIPRGDTAAFEWLLPLLLHAASPTASAARLATEAARLTP
jgi:hypothetical protein